MDYKISADLTYTWEMLQGFFTNKFLDDFGTTTSCFLNGYKIYFYWDNIQGFLQVLRTWDDGGGGGGGGRAH